MKVYISGPMHGVPDENADAFALAASRLASLGHEVLTPFDVGGSTLSVDERFLPPVDTGPASDLPARLLGDLSLICRWAEAVVTLPDRSPPSLGMAAEVATARAIGIFVLTLDEACVARGGGRWHEGVRGMAAFVNYRSHA